MKTSLRLHALNGIMFKLAEILGRNAVQLAVSVVLARLIAPSSFGVIALAAIFLQICNDFLISGFPAALIQKADSTYEDECTVFFFGVISASVLCLLIFLNSSQIAGFFSEPDLAAVASAISVILVIDSIGQVHATLLRKSFKFKEIAKANIFSLVISGPIAVLLAFKGFAVWALVIQQVMSSIVRNYVLWRICGWRPRLIFKVVSLKELLPFGAPLMGAALIGSISNNIFSALIGKFHSSLELAYYSRSKQLPWLVVSTLTGAVSSVMFPVYSSMKGDLKRIKAATEKSIRVIYFCMGPCMAYLYFGAEQIIHVLFTGAWLPAVPYMKLLVLSFISLPLQGQVLDVFNAVGRSDLYFRLEVVKKLLMLAVLAITFRLGVEAMIVGQIFLSLFNVVINGVFCERLIGYRLSAQIQDSCVTLSVAFLCGWASHEVAATAVAGAISQLVLGGLLTVVSYIVFSVVTRQESAYFLLDVARRRNANPNS